VKPHYLICTLGLLYPETKNMKELLGLESLVAGQYTGHTVPEVFRCVMSQALAPLWGE
jgi:hypothetical protein